jgi:hypothetical protein
MGMETLRASALPLGYTAVPFRYGSVEQENTSMSLVRRLINQDINLILIDLLIQQIQA